MTARRLTRVAPCTLACVLIAACGSSVPAAGSRSDSLAGPTPIAKLAGSSGHWNSPIIVDGHVLEPEGNANDRSLVGSLELFSAG